MTKGYSGLNAYRSVGKKSESPISKDYISCNAAIHSNDGEFTKNSNKYISGGHGQTAIDYMDKNNIAYEVNIEYNNGVRVGNIIDSKNKKFKTGNNHTWFPKDWSIGDIREAGENVSGYFKSQGNIKDGQHYSLMYKGVEVTVIYQEGEVSTIFPSKNQSGGRKND